MSLPPTKPDQIRQGITISGLFIPEAMEVFHVVPFGLSTKSSASLDRLPPADQQIMRESLDQALSQAGQIPSWIDGVPVQLRELYLAEDKQLTVKQWVNENCIMDDGLIRLLNFEQMAIYFHGERITIKDGIAGFIHYRSAFKNAAGAINLSC